MAIDPGERVHVERRGVVPIARPFEEAFAPFNAADAGDFVRAFGEAFEDFMVDRAEAIQRHIVEGVPLS